MTRHNQPTRDTCNTRHVQHETHATREKQQHRKRALSVAKRPREIYSAKARRQDAHFLRKLQNDSKIIVSGGKFEGIWGRWN